MAETVKIVYFGDSITAGQYVNPDLRWTNLVDNEIQQKNYRTSVNFHCLNRSVSGETSRQGLERFASDVQNNYPDILTIQFGLNDCNYWVTDRGVPRVSEASYRANLIEMIDRALRFGVKRIILSTNHRTMRRKVLVGNVSLEVSRKVYNDIVREVAEQCDVALCDVDSAFEAFGEDELEKMLLPYPDLLHLSEKGHGYYKSVIIPYIYEAIDVVLGDSSSIPSI